MKGSICNFYDFIHYIFIDALSANTRSLRFYQIELLLM